MQLALEHITFVFKSAAFSLKQRSCQLFSTRLNPCTAATCQVYNCVYYVFTEDITLTCFEIRSQINQLCQPFRGPTPFVRRFVISRKIMYDLQILNPFREPRKVFSWTPAVRGPQLENLSDMIIQVCNANYFKVTISSLITQPFCNFHWLDLISITLSFYVDLDYVSIVDHNLSFILFHKHNFTLLLYNNIIGNCLVQLFY